MTNLVIVESPTKIKKIQQYLPDGFVVESCVGHIRDLPSKKSEIPAAIKDEPWADYGIDIENDFRPHYITIRGKGKVIEQLKKKLKGADALYLATDEDREGESISWHLIESLDPKVPVKRMVFNEITKTAIREALENPRDLDMDLVQAQETRRILDRLYGYALSPLLWKKIGGNLSAGRVQSVAVRLVVNRERERRAFVTGTYWDLVADLDHGGPFRAKLVTVDGKRIATGKDFDKDTGRIAEGRDVLLLDEPAARDLQGRLREVPWSVSDVQTQARSTRPPAPFITSTLQQEANNRLNLSARRAMQVAQSLYQNGFITYMRTDSTALSQEGIEGARAAVREEFGDRYLPASARTYQGKKAKGAQEAHEAIRPAGEVFVHPDRSGLRGEDLSLYRLVWRRTLACQMTDEMATHTTVTLKAAETTFSATGKHVDDPGFRLAWPAGRSDDAELPALQVGDQPDVQGISAEGHETKPPARFTEATLVQALENEAIGRPSTYASILDTIQRRGYVVHKGKALVPTFTAFAVTTLLERHFPDLVDAAFTANMEETLDLIASGEAEWVPFLRDFFLGHAGLRHAIDTKMDAIDAQLAKEVDLGTDLGAAVRIGRYGAYVEAERDGETVRATIPETMTPDELDASTLERLLVAKAEGPAQLGKDPETGLPVYILEGRFGPYYQLGDGDGGKPKRASLPKGKGVDDADLDEALFLLSLPRELGDHPAGGDIIAGLGRYGPYVAHRPADGKPEYRSLPAGKELRHVTHQDALDLLAQPKRGRGGAQKVIAELGAHPKGGKPVRVLDGRYGPYVKHEKTNATVPKDRDASKVTLEEAVALLEAKKSRR